MHRRYPDARAPSGRLITDVAWPDACSLMVVIFGVSTGVGNGVSQAVKKSSRAVQFVSVRPAPRLPGPFLRPSGCRSVLSPHPHAPGRAGAATRRTEGIVKILWLARICEC